MRSTVTCCLVLMMFVPRLFGCDASPLRLRRVTPDVTLVVKHRDKAVSGIEITIFREKNVVPVFAGATNRQGTFIHKPFAVGKYFVRTSYEGFDAPTEWIEVVSPGARVAREIDIHWADWSYETGVVRGWLTGLVPGNTGNRLMDIAHPVKTFYPGVTLSLKGAFSGDEYRTISDSTGGFVFQSVSDGVYILTIAGGMKTVYGIGGVTRLVLDVVRNSKVNSLPLDLRDNGCGGIEFQFPET